MDENKGQVSIILNCFNGEKYLKEAIDSVIKQTYKNWELIFWDNRSTDLSKNIFDSFECEKLRYFVSSNHTSLYEARNLALEKCRGEFVAFIDADDLWEEDKLEKQIKLFEKKTVGMVYGNLWIYNEKTKKRKILSKKKLLQGKIGDKILSNYNIGVITSILKKNFIVKNKLYFDQKYDHIGDFDLFFKLSKICEFEAIQEPVATYRIHGENLSLKSSHKEILELKYWISKNDSLLSKDQRGQFLKRLINKEFIYIKFNYSFFDTLKYLFKNKPLFKNPKNFILLILPNFILRKIMWYQ